MYTSLFLVAVVYTIARSVCLSFFSVLFYPLCFRFCARYFPAALANPNPFFDVWQADVSRVTGIDEEMVLRTLSSIPESEDVLRVVDGDKYNLLQKAIIWNKVAIVEALLRRRFDDGDGDVFNRSPMVASGVDGSVGDASNRSPMAVSGGDGVEEAEEEPEEVNRPLHLACFLGKCGGECHGPNAAYWVGLKLVLLLVTSLPLYMSYRDRSIVAGFWRIHSFIHSFICRTEIV